MLQAPIGVTASVNDGGISNRKRSDMGIGVEVFGIFPIFAPEAFLAGSLDARIVSSHSVCKAYRHMIRKHSLSMDIL